MGERDYLRGIKKKFMQGLKSRRDESRGENKAEGMRPNDFVKAEAGAKLKQMYGMGGTMKYRKGGANLAMTNSEAVRSGRAGRGAGEQEYGMGGKMEYEKGGMLKALLEDPKQRDMARAILSDTNTKAVTDGKAGRYEMGGEVPVVEEEKQTFIMRSMPKSTEDYPAEIYNASMPILKDMLRGSKLAPEDEQMVAEYIVGTEDIGSVNPRLRDMARAARQRGMDYLRSEAGGEFIMDKYFDQKTGEEVSEDFIMGLQEKGESFRPLSDTGEGRYVYEIR
tara:strand:- start:58 stop:894 length:837 start_codon:yes stop_codon:yes gene_type:complete